MTGHLETFFQSLTGPWGYVFLFFSTFVENLFPPLPGDTFLVLGAFLVGRGQMSFFPAYITTLLGSICGFMTCYAIGRKWGRSWFRGKRGRIFSREHLVRVEKWFARYGDWVLVFNRFLSGFRAVVSFFAGTARMNAGRVFLFAFISCLLWNGILMGLGFYLGQNWAVFLKGYQRFIFILIILFLAGWWVKTMIQKHRKLRHE